MSFSLLTATSSIHLSAFPLTIQKALKFTLTLSVTRLDDGDVGYSCILWKEGFALVRITAGLFGLFEWETGEGCLPGHSLRTGKTR